MIRRPPRSTRMTHSFPTRRTSDLGTLAFALLIPTMMLTTAASSVQGTALQLMAPPRMRGRVIAIYLLFVTLVGMGIGPLLIGVLSDHWFTAADGLPPAMASVALSGRVIAAILLALVRRQTRALMVRHRADAPPADRKSTVQGQDVEERVELGG